MRKGVIMEEMQEATNPYFGLSDHRKFVFCGKSEHYFEGDTAAFSIGWFFEDINIYG